MENDRVGVAVAAAVGATHGVGADVHADGTPALRPLALVPPCRRAKMPGMELSQQLPIYAPRHVSTCFLQTTIAARIHGQS